MAHFAAVWIHQKHLGLGVHQIVWPYISVDNKLAMSCLHVHRLPIVGHDGEGPTHRETPAQQGFKTCWQARKPVYMAARHRTLVLPSAFEQVVEGCCVGCTQKMPQVPWGPKPASSICCHPRTDHATSWGYQQCLARIARLHTPLKGFEEGMAPWQQPSKPSTHCEKGSAIVGELLNIWQIWQVSVHGMHLHRPSV